LTSFLNLKIDNKKSSKYHGFLKKKEAKKKLPRLWLASIGS